MTEQETTGQVVEKKSSKKMIFIIVGAVVVIGAVIGILFATGIIGGGGDEEIDPNAADPNQAIKPAKPVKAMPAVALEPFVVNLADTDQTRFLKVTIVIELTDEKLVEQVELVKNNIRDAIINLLSSKTYIQIRNSKGKLRLKQELTQRLNEIFQTNAVNDVLFTDFIVS